MNQLIFMKLVWFLSLVWLIRFFSVPDKYAKTSEIRIPSCRCERIPSCSVTKKKKEFQVADVKAAERR